MPKEYIPVKQYLTQNRPTMTACRKAMSLARCDLRDGHGALNQSD